MRSSSVTAAAVTSPLAAGVGGGRQAQVALQQIGHGYALIGIDACQSRWPAEVLALGAGAQQAARVRADMGRELVMVEEQRGAMALVLGRMARRWTLVVAACELMPGLPLAFGVVIEHAGCCMLRTR